MLPHRFPSCRPTEGSSPLWRAVALLLLAGLLLSAAGAWARGGSAGKEATAGDKETARALMDEGDRKVRAGDYQGALDAYIAADKIMRVPTTGIEVGRVQERLGRLLEARDTWLRVARHPARPDEPEPFTLARNEARALAAKVGTRIPSLRVEVQGVAEDVEVAVRIDGTELPPGTHRHPRKVNPGEKLIQASAAGYRPAGEHVRLQEGQNILVELVLEPLPPGSVGHRPEGAAPERPPGSDDADGGGISPLVWIGFGIGGAGLAVGAITGALSLAKTSELESEHCVNNACPPAVEGDIEDAELLANISNVGFAVGAVGVVLGIVGIALSGSEDAESSSGHSTAAALEPAIGPGWVGVTGRF